MLTPPPRAPLSAALVAVTAAPLLVTVAAIGYVFRPEGGFLMAGATISMPAPAQRPAEAQSCVAEEFTWVRT